jgi:DNA-binding winged helix-turn-helix (wHTH) protein/predicted Zn-dependent protease
MNSSVASLRFGEFELSADGELLKSGQRVKLAGQPIRVLQILLEVPGRTVTREELQKRIWPGDSFGDFDHGLNAAVQRLRDVLGDSAAFPKFIETVPRRGYRFIAQLHASEEGEKASRLPKHLALILSLTAAGLVFGSLMSLSPIARHYNNRGAQLQQVGDLQGAIKSYQRALMFRSNYAEAHYNLADVYEELPAYDRALEEYQKAIEADPKFYEAYNNLARLHIKRRKDSGAALELLERAINMNPQEPSVLYSLYKNYGWANYELQLTSQAETSLRRAIALDQSRGSAHCLLAKVLDVQEERGTALKEWESCAAYSGQQEVEPEWRAEAKERLNKEAGR